MASPNGDDYPRLPLPRRTRSLDVHSPEGSLPETKMNIQGQYGSDQQNYMLNSYQFHSIPENTPRGVRPPGIPLPPSPQGLNGARSKPGLPTPKEEQSQEFYGFSNLNSGVRARPYIPQQQQQQPRTSFQGDDMAWATGYSNQAMANTLARTTSAPPLGSPLLKMNDFGEYRNHSEASTPDQSPSFSPLTFNSQASSPDRERRQAIGLPRTKLSRTSSCPPLGDVEEGDEYFGANSEEGSGQDDSTASLKNKRKRLLAAAGGVMVSPPSNGIKKVEEWSMGGNQEGEDGEAGGSGSMSMSISEGGGRGGSVSAGAVTSTKHGSLGRVGERAKAGKEEDKKYSFEATPKDYIHVRARRGQATDSHSLAERVRRERISERMKVLQDLVPTCSKVTGKAVMLDEIINYVRSLQMQVELLSSKLAAIDNESRPSAGQDRSYNNMESSNHLLPNQTMFLQQLQNQQQQQTGLQDHRMQSPMVQGTMAELSSLLSGSSVEGINALASLGLSGYSASELAAMGLAEGGSAGIRMTASAPLMGGGYGESSANNLEAAISETRLQELLSGSTVGMRSLALNQMQGNDGSGGSGWGSGNHGYMDLKRDGLNM